MLRKTVSGLTRVLALGAAAAVVLMMAITVADVVGRSLFKSPVAGTVEVVEVLMVAAVFLMMAHTQEQDGHIRLDFAVQRLPFRSRQVAMLLTNLFSLCVVGFITWGAAESGYQSWLVKEFRFGAAPIPIWPAKLLLPLGLLLLWLQLAMWELRLVGTLIDHRRAEDGRSGHRR